MYDNIGRKIKGLAKAIFIVLGISMAITGIVIMCIDEDLILYGVLTLILGPILAWISSWLLYGFGEIIDKLCDIEHNTRMIMKPSELKKVRNHHESETKKAETAKRELKKQKEAIAEEENAVIIECPDCGEELFFDKELSHAECPYCGCNIKIK